MAHAGTKLISNNRKARFNYELFDRLEVGIALKGTEVKSLREGKLNLGESYCRIEDDAQIYLVDAHIGQYGHGNVHNHEPTRPRKLLLHKREILRLRSRVREKGLTLVPTRAYFARGKVKLEIALAKGKQQYDKRQAAKKRDTEREMRRAQREGA
ncbi:MAG: SsrA-binding protein SmpB [SAR324 cluster bacterium]|nr:SsrA-binding protein SmpB [SAR324 cluster bacterium]MCZ6841236.1 SsrA-binding protein SmpB [SAR324 cluster bacterium]